MAASNCPIATTYLPSASDVPAGETLLDPGASTTFTIGFAPSVPGVYTALISIAITVGIITILLRETIAFIQLPEIELTDFLFGTTWSPLLGAEKHFGIWPLICGTFLVSIVAAMTAIPLGLITAIYMSEYATAGKRAILKPIIEILAGVPTVVYGFFALLVITPALQGACNFLFGAPKIKLHAP